MNVDKILLQIRAKRQSLNYSQEYVASVLQISQGSYNKIENGTTELTVKMLLEIAQILDLAHLHLIPLKSNNLT